METIIDSNLDSIETSKNNDNDENDLTSKHRKERKELQAKIQSLKKSATKGDKKKRKEVLEEIAKLEIDLDKRQAKELNDLNHTKCILQNNYKAEEKLEKENSKNVNIEIGNEQGQRVSKAQRRRERKAKEEKEKEAEILAQEEINKTGPRMIELKTIKGLLKSRGLMLHPILSDGNCLYNAIRHQLEITGRTNYDISYLRNETATYIYKNKSNLISYMTNSETGNMLTDEEFKNYCEAIRSTPAWGGQVEIKALSRILQVPIEILQATGPPTMQGDKEYEDPPLIITYHRYMYSLGEHYNSTKPLGDDNSDDENDHEILEENRDSN